MSAPDDSARLESASDPLENTFDLLERARGGDERSREQLYRRFLPVLQRWAHQQLPRTARDLSETDDLVQITLLRTLKHVEHFEHRGEGAFLGYLRHILLNAARDEARRGARRKPHDEVPDSLADAGPSPVEQLLGRDTHARYERGLQALGDEQREAVILRLEMDYSHAEIAAALGKSSANAARMLVARGLLALAERMRDDA
jgi:RNA polymerase sigma-70 factor (ECF subfamily)